MVQPLSWGKVSSSTMRPSAATAGRAVLLSGDDGTVDPAEVIERLSTKPSDPLFSHDGLDDFISGTSSYGSRDDPDRTRLAERRDSWMTRQQPPSCLPAGFRARSTRPPSIRR
jgi:hypothetical protein